jgi:hypothetical protein
MPVPPAAEDKSPTVVAANGDRRASSSTRILLVEDHTDTADIMARLLGARGYHVATAGSAAAALELGEQLPFDLIISDLGLPDKDGYELIREFRARWPIPAIALSGYGAEDDIDKSRACGFAEHLTKPVNFQSLLNAIGRLST